MTGGERIRDELNDILRFQIGIDGKSFLGRLGIFWRKKTTDCRCSHLSLVINLLEKWVYPGLPGLRDVRSTKHKRNVFNIPPIDHPVRRRTNKGNTTIFIVDGSSMNDTSAYAAHYYNHNINIENNNNIGIRPTFFRPHDVNNAEEARAHDDMFRTCNDDDGGAGRTREPRG